MENYFNYFTEIEECFRRQRGAPSLLSTLDWALIESWKEAGIPLDVVCRGVERTFEKYARQPRHFRRVNAVAYCTQEIMRAAAEAATAAVESGTAVTKNGQEAPPFTPEQVAAFLSQCAEALNQAARRLRAAGNEVTASDLEENAAAAGSLAARGGDVLLGGLEALERTLTAIEDRLSASLARGTPLELIVRFREEVDRGLAACRGKMTAAQLSSIERQFLKKRLFEHYQLPRLSLFYL